MQQKTLLRVAVCVSIAGAIVLFLLSPDISAQDTVLRAEVVDVRSTGKVWFVDVVPSELTVISFDPINASEVSGRHDLIGRLASYEGKIEFIVEDLR